MTDVLDIEWQEAQKWERAWHGNCVNTYNEETKQFIYAHYMGLDLFAFDYYGQRGWQMGNRSIMDIGAGPCSMLLKTQTTGIRIAIDPCPYPEWVNERYSQSEICLYQGSGEEINTASIFDRSIFDEVWIYNCLQHTKDPKCIIENALSKCRTLRIFEWINEGISPGHLHNLTAPELDAWLGGKGRAEQINNGPCVGNAYYGIFKGKHFNC